MYKTIIYLPSVYLFSYLFTYIRDLFPTELVAEVKANTNSVEIHPQLSNNGHPVDGAMVGAGSLWLSETYSHVRDVEMRPCVGCRVKYFTQEILMSKKCLNI